MEFEKEKPYYCPLDLKGWVKTGSNCPVNCGR